VADIFDEIGEDLRAERAQKMFARYGWILMVLAVLAVAGAGGWQWWRGRQQHRAEIAAGLFLAASREASGPAPGTAETASRKAAAATFERLATRAPESYRTLARLRLAAVQAGSDPAAALQTWDGVASDPRADPVLRGLATLLWAQHQLDGGDPAAIEARLRPLAHGSGPWQALAQEQLAWLDLRQGQDQQARDLLRGLAADPLAPQGVRTRAGGLLAQLGEAAPQAAATIPVVTPVAR
jgi:hypothetical protein